MTYTLVDRCEGYTIESEIDVLLGLSTGDSKEVVKRFAGWESKDGRRTSFRMQSYANGERDDSYSGAAELSSDGSGQATYQGAEPAIFELPPGTMLSAVQLRDLIRAGQAAQPIVVQSVMDGSFEDGPYRVTGYISPARNLATADRDAPMSFTVSSDARLLANIYWPVTLAYFPIGVDTETPEYEVNLQLLPNGVVRAMTQDFGSYSLKMSLVRLSPRESDC